MSRRITSSLCSTNGKRGCRQLRAKAHHPHFPPKNALCLPRTLFSPLLGWEVALHPGDDGFIGESNVFAKAAITFELRFGKELVQRGVVWELLVLAAVVENVWWLVSGEGGLDVEDVAELTGMGVLGIAICAVDAMGGVGWIFAEGRQTFGRGWGLLMRNGCGKAGSIGGRDVGFEDVGGLRRLLLRQGLGGGFCWIGGCGCGWSVMLGLR